jgi:hypothetical protein
LDIHFTAGISCEKAASFTEKNAAAAPRTEKSDKPAE